MTASRRDTLMDDSAAVLRMVIAQLRDLQLEPLRPEAPAREGTPAPPGPGDGR